MSFRTLFASALFTAAFAGTAHAQDDTTQNLNINLSCFGKCSEVQVQGQAPGAVGTIQFDPNDDEDDFVVIEVAGSRWVATPMAGRHKVRIENYYGAPRVISTTLSFVNTTELDRIETLLVDLSGDEPTWAPEVTNKIVLAECFFEDARPTTEAGWNWAIPDRSIVQDACRWVNPYWRQFDLEGMTWYVEFGHDYTGDAAKDTSVQARESRARAEYLVQWMQSQVENVEFYIPPTATLANRKSQAGVVLSKVRPLPEPHDACGAGHLADFPASATTTGIAGDANSDGVYTWKDCYVAPEIPELPKPPRMLASAVTDCQASVSGWYCGAGAGAFFPIGQGLKTGGYPHHFRVAGTLGISPGLGGETVNGSPRPVNRWQSGSPISSWSLAAAFDWEVTKKGALKLQLPGFRVTALRLENTGYPQEWLMSVPVGLRFHPLAKAGSLTSSGKAKYQPLSITLSGFAGTAYGQSYPGQQVSMWGEHTAQTMRYGTLDYGATIQFEFVRPLKSTWGR